MLQGKMMEVIGIGALNLDLLYEVDDLSLLRQRGWGFAPGKEATISADRYQELLELLKEVAVLRARSGGGSAANTICALARMGFRTGFVGRVGDDEEGAFILDQMPGVDISHVKRGGRSGICIVILDKRKDRALAVQPNANDEITLADLDIPYLSATRYLHLSSFVGDTPLAAQLQLMELLPAAVKVSIDPGELYARRGLEAILPLIKRSSLFFATEDELSSLTGADDYSRACLAIATLGPEIVVCKRGKEGAYLYSREYQGSIRHNGVTSVIDNTGAGDVFNAGFLAGLLLGRPLPYCLELANRLAAKSLGGYGRTCYPDSTDLAAPPRG